MTTCGTLPPPRFYSTQCLPVTRNTNRTEDMRRKITIQKARLHDAVHGCMLLSLLANIPIQSALCKLNSIVYSLILRCHLVLACSRHGLWYRILVSVKFSLAGPNLRLSSAPHSYSFLLFLLDLVKFDKQVIARSTTATTKTARRKKKVN